MHEDQPLHLRADFDTFVRSAYPGLLGVATALTGTVFDAEDMVQDTMLKAFIGWNRISGYEQPHGWAHRVLVNRCVGWWRRRRTEARYLASLRRQEAVSAGPSPDALAFWQAVRRPIGGRLQRELAGLYSARRGAYRVVYEISEGQRAVVVLRIDHRSRVYRTR